MNLLLSPHPDDETLFGAYIIMTYKPLVLICTDSWLQYKRGSGITYLERREETRQAMQILGDILVDFLFLPDSEVTGIMLQSALNEYLGFLDETIEKVFAPQVESGNIHHDMVGKVADKLFTNIIHYSTYAKGGVFQKIGEKVSYTEEMRQKKIEALKCYKSQINYSKTEYFFKQGPLDEYIVT